MGFLSVKVALISTGIVSMAMGLKLTVPVIISEAPSICSFFLTCLTPPYLYILLNFIILTIFATSKLHNHPQEYPLLPTEPLIYDGPSTPPPHIPAEPLIYDGTSTPPPQIPAVVSDGFDCQQKTTLNDVADTNGNGYDQNVTLEPLQLQRKDSLDFAFSDENERPPVSARFSHRKAVRASPEGAKVVALGVAKPKRQDTLENTWRTITEGRPMPLTRHLKKSDTWESHGRRNAAPLTDLNGATPVMKKSETYGGREREREKGASPGSGSGGRLRKEPSLSQDELNRRVEAFINKFNEEMRLQRQESLRQYREMMNGGAH